LGALLDGEMTGAEFLTYVEQVQRGFSEGA
jgi:hypothetical protein